MKAGISPGRREALGALGMVVAVLAGCDRKPVVVSPGPGAPFPSLASLRPLNSGQAALPLPSGEDALVINFWASWCGPCRTEMPSLQQLDNQLRGTGMRVVAVSIDRDRFLAEEFIRSVRVDFPVYFDANGEYSTQALGLRTLPETFVVDASGTIRARVSGAWDWSSAESVRLVTGKSSPPLGGSPGYRGTLPPY
jgi:thiol-disulfide isomerase/thioredoxin